MTKRFNKVIREQLGPQLQKIREAKNLTPAQVSLECDLSTDNIIKMEQAKRISVDKYKILARYYGKAIKLFLVDG